VCGLNTLKTSALKLRPLKFSLKKRQKSYETEIQELRETTKEFPNLKDWDGAVRGMFMLYDTYDFNLTEASKGNLVFVVKKICSLNENFYLYFQTFSI
jgi:hypothetical protein